MSKPAHIPDKPRRPPSLILSNLTVKDIERFFTRFQQTDGCWSWQATITREGYGRFYYRVSKHLRAHRVAFALFNGREPGDVLDHLCRNRRCVNPRHLEEVSHNTNVLRGNSIFGQNSRKTHCKNGHALTSDNLMNTPSYKGTRVCRICTLAYRKAWWIKRKEAKAKAVPTSVIQDMRDKLSKG